MRFVSAIFAFVAATATGGTSFAATVTATKGQVLINRGGGYQLVVGTTDANPGTTIVVNPGGSARVVYPDGCAEMAEPFSVYTINAKSPCESKTDKSATGNSTTGSMGISNIVLYTIGGAVAAGGGIVAYLALTHTAKAASP
jgi:hypothetical protein